MRPRLIAVDDPRVRRETADEESASMRPRLIAVDDQIVYHGTNKDITLQ